MTGHFVGDVPAFPSDSLITRLGITVTTLTPERVEGTMPVQGNTQTHGVLHGGASAALAETLGSLGAAAHGGPDTMALGVDLNITHHRAAREGLVTGYATPVHRGRTLATYVIEIKDEDGNLIATARLTCLIRSRRGT